MISGPQKCVACGYVGWDVGPRLVRLEGDKPFGVRVLCVDSEACEERQFQERRDAEVTT